MSFEASSFHEVVGSFGDVVGSAMEKDFYLNERACAAYFEKDWTDRLIAGGMTPRFTFAQLEPSALYSDYHERLADFLKEKLSAPPLKMLEVGSSLGRTYFEICRRFESLNEAVLIEPSWNLANGFAKIFKDRSPQRFQILRGNVDLQDVLFDTAEITAACARVKTRCLNEPFQNLKEDLGTFDLVVCSNVVDQTKDHEKLVGFLKNAVPPGGSLLLSCTYQWQEKYIGIGNRQTANILEWFKTGWQLRGETNIPFRVRVFERHWLEFLSHVVLVQRD